MLKEKYGNYLPNKKRLLLFVLITTCITLMMAFAQTESARSEEALDMAQEDLTNEQARQAGNISDLMTMPKEEHSSTLRITLRRTQVDSAIENLTEPMTQVTIKPYNEDGVEGLALSNIKANSIFSRMGLLNGDVLVAVEGQPLTSPDQVLQLYESLKSSETTNLEINREGLVYSMKYRIR